jgi:hypothetical protein
MIWLRGFADYFAWRHQCPYDWTSLEAAQWNDGFCAAMRVARKARS